MDEGESGTAKGQLHRTEATMNLNNDLVNTESPQRELHHEESNLKEHNNVIENQLNQFELQTDSQEDLKINYENNEVESDGNEGNEQSMSMSMNNNNINNKPLNIGSSININGQDEVQITCVENEDRNIHSEENENSRIVTNDNNENNDIDNEHYNENNHRQHQLNNENYNSEELNLQAEFEERWKNVETVEKPFSRIKQTIIRPLITDKLSSPYNNNNYSIYNNYIRPQDIRVQSIANSFEQSEMINKRLKELNDSLSFTDNRFSIESHNIMKNKPLTVEKGNKKYTNNNNKTIISKYSNKCLDLDEFIIEKQKQLDEILNRNSKIYANSSIDRSNDRSIDRSIDNNTYNTYHSTNNNAIKICDTLNSNVITINNNENINNSSIDNNIYDKIEIKSINNRYSNKSDKKNVKKDNSNSNSKEGNSNSHKNHNINSLKNNTIILSKNRFDFSNEMLLNKQNMEDDNYENFMNQFITTLYTNKKYKNEDNEVLDKKVINSTNKYVTDKNLLKEINLITNNVQKYKSKLKDCEENISAMLRSSKLSKSEKVEKPKILNLSLINRTNNPIVKI